MHSFASRLTRGAEEARDLVQETYLRAYRTFDNFRPGTNCKAWLLTILYSIFINRYRKRQREPKTVPLEDLEERFHQSLVTQPEIERSSLWSDGKLEKAVEQLPEAFRSVLLLVDVEDLTYEEAAQALGCPVGTVRSRLSRARRQLSLALREEGSGPGQPRGSQGRV